MEARYCPGVGHFYKFKRGDQVVIVSCGFKGCSGVVESAVDQRTVDYSDEYVAGYHVVLDDGLFYFNSYISKISRLLSSWYSSSSTKRSPGCCRPWRDGVSIVSVVQSM